MAKHKFQLGLGDERGNIVGAQCVHCGQIALYGADGKVPDDIQTQECKREDASQAAARIVREATSE